ncbi:MAG: hypothetical protein E6H78_06860 [Betaproteobacteria bacterium]|nr:MAG: hypothetical protein E6H78_06860 [Betaproteobacteria bacterium]
MDETTSARTSSAGWLGAVLIVALCVIATTTASADDDLPTRVGRVSESAGPLYLAPEDRASDWATIGQNYPVTAGDNLRVAPEGRAEVDFGSGQLRLAGDTNIQITALDEHRFAFFVRSGRVILRLRTLDPGDSATIDTAHAQIQLDRPGSYRLDVAPESQQTILTVREGEADMRFGAGMQHVLPGQTATVAASDPGNVALRNGFGTDGFDAWSVARDRTYDASPSAAYVSREMVGASDLGYYGTWENYGSYGNVWFPTTVAVGWAPYRFGRWVWCGPWGWTWVDDAPWGFAPFHYGRWVSVSGRWGWCPGALVRRPVWAPALVGWFRGPGWGFSRTLGTPVFGWVPLSWGEPFWPHWRCSGDCWRRLNHPYAVTAAERRGSAPVHFANGDVPGAITAVPGHILSGSKPVAVNLVHVSRTTLAGAPILTIAPFAPRPDRGGRMVSAPPVHDNAHNNTRDKAHDSVSASFRQPAPRVYVGVSDGRGAYKGVAPTPGPKLPANGDRSYSPMIRPAAPPVARIVPAPVLAPAPAVAPVAPLMLPAQSAAAHSASPARGQVPPTVNAVPGGAPPK